MLEKIQVLPYTRQMISREEYLRKEYERRINKAIDFVYQNYQEEFLLTDLADIAAFSRFHFHRLFLALTGETPGEFVKRVRLTNAAGMLRNNPGKSITDIALCCGFSNPSIFTRQFKEHFQVTPNAWRKKESNGRQNPSNNSQTVSNDGEASNSGMRYDQGILEFHRRNAMKKLKYEVEVKDMPELHVAYARHIGAYNGIGEAFARISKWAGPRGYFTKEAMVLAVYHDDPDTTPESKRRSSACITVPKGTQTDGDIGIMTIPGGKFAIGHFEISQDEFGAAWNALLGEWLPESGWQCDDRMCYEVYLNDHEKHPERKFIVDICEPIRPL